MKKTTALLFAVILSGLMIFAVAQSNKSERTVWKYEVPKAPYGYDKGTLILTKENNVITGVVQMGSGYNINLQNVSLVNDTIRGNAYIDSEYVALLGNVRDSVIVGTVDTSMGLMDFKAVRDKNK